METNTRFTGFKAEQVLWNMRLSEYKYKETRKSVVESNGIEFELAAIP